MKYLRGYGSISVNREFVNEFIHDAELQFLVYILHDISKTKLGRKLLRLMTQKYLITDMVQILCS